MISTETNRTAELTTDGAETEFDFELLIHDDSEIQVWYQVTGGDYTQLTLDTHYTVVFTESGGTVTTIGASSPYAAGKILIIRHLEITQQTNWLFNDNHTGPQHESDFDRAVMRDLQIQEQLDRAVGFAITSPTSGIEFPEPLSDNIIGWNTAATALENKSGVLGIVLLPATDGNFIVGDGTEWIVESGAVARASIGLGTGDSPTLTGLTLSGLTAGRVLFAGASGVISDDGKLLWNNTTKRLTATGMTVTGNSVFGLNSSVFQPTTDSTTFFQVLDANGGTPILNVDSTNERVGLGTDSPSVTLEVAGDVIIGASGENKILTFPATSTGKESRIDFVGQGATPIISLVREGTGSDFLAMESGSGAAMQRWSKFGGVGFPNIVVGFRYVFETSTSSESAVMVRNADGVSNTRPVFVVREGNINDNGSLMELQNRSGDVKVVFLNGGPANNYEFGLGEPEPETLFEMTGIAPYLTLHNSTHEDSDGGRESRLNFKGEQSGGEETTLARIEIGHDGAADDEKGYLDLFINDGDDGDSPTKRLRVDTTGLEVDGVIRSTSSEWWRIQHVDISALPATGVVGAQRAIMDADNLTGYQLDNNPSAEYLYFNVHVGTDWDAGSDLEFIVQFETNVDNSGGNGADTVDFDLLMYYKGAGETTQKTQDLDGSVVVGTAAAQYHEQVTFIIPYDTVDHEVEIGDCISLRLMLDTTDSDVDNVIVHHGMFRYRTNKVRAEI